MANFEIWARKDKTKPLTPEISYHVTSEDFLFADAKWSVYKQINCPDPPPAHHDWHWRHKATTATHHAFVALKYAAEIEGMMMICLDPRPSRLREARDQNLLYIEYLETAPWNQKAYANSTTKFLGVGTCLIDVAIELSCRYGCEGRLGLHSLNDAKKFYVDQGFQNLGEDPEESLDYFELSDKVL